MEFETSQDKTSNSPIPRDKLAALIRSTYTTLQEQGTASVDQLLQRVLEHLNAHSSFYKYIVSVTTLESRLEPHNSEDCTMSNAIGASWNSRKDGLFNYDLPDEQKGVKHLVTVIWVAKQ
ncbi:TDA2 (YER071C) [Zygosaccharomyces parabailii]|uniref:Topoisomerase I damage affected protein 2 n=1 Tax=Zygosaccharomyces bailii (strain CLIB 213 / ATCC 58445 / CBS 680 / BCRC 21525 / NBRC 1098 / NCYC 1416 / NRRL Y-2227) TaxID=1333698 RepID=A0A8J2T5G4_ZYGB2|nr:TDA2 (YER071C) [Zygosaccharomyces parabailii]CDF89379.1 ZYBA0S04-02894g1_1 [Zygosaccharomyces bailii CLIB 213]CDH08338.1 probable Topoisomerase I damage affected protein 2 [Zygosaccharomyces bailii ISA1307]SJM85775.1 probable Topoisomerase I damage affected protein 2 [Zygosaccharomyces bailii]